MPLDDIARHVGHRSTTTTAGYVRLHRSAIERRPGALRASLEVPAVQTVTLTDPSLRGREMRQNSPFAGLLTDEERATIIAQWRNQASKQ